jgi:phosphatidylserine/phosphatidylglycerophosphate/cardiolipin synthase-like enzyme
MIGSATALQPAADDLCSDWSAWISARTRQTPGFAAYFNRGVIASQWLTRRCGNDVANEHKTLAATIADPTSPVRAFLAGPAREALLGLLTSAKHDGSVLYTALYELDDPELIAALSDVGAHANVLLASGAFGPGKPDENAAVRAKLKTSTRVHVVDRLVKGDHFAHNKFVVVCDANGTPKRVWTGSTNWTMTGLCTQANNALLIDDPKLAAGYLDYWHRLATAGNEYPPALSAADATPTVTPSTGTAWLTPVQDHIDLDDAAKRIHSAEHGVLFLMFVPGPNGTLLDDVIALDANTLYIHGVVNQDPGGPAGAALTLVSRGKELSADPEIIVPAAISKQLEYWQPELRQYTNTMVHSKVIVIDPFGAHPVVMTGSHNLGPKASKDNDDNLVIVKDAPGLAAEYAVNIMGIYDQYKWRYNFSKASSPNTWDGLADDDKWQDKFLTGAHARELSFWFGDDRAAAASTARAPHRRVAANVHTRA